MNLVESTLLEQMENEKFQRAMNDDFTFADSLIDQKDLDKLKEVEDNVCDD